MMKSLLFAAALLAGGSALAQDNPDATVAVPDPVTVAVPDATAAETGMTVQTDLAAPAGQMVLPSNADPERDARGIPVISAPAIAPPGFNQVPGTTLAIGGPLLEPTDALATQPATESYPACTREVTDHCVQTYERSRRPS
jgi:hypothetical protein